jgi:ATP-dependent helicase HrpA
MEVHTLAELNAALADCMPADRRVLQRLWHRLRHQRGRPGGSPLASEFQDRLARARERLQRRAEMLPAPTFPAELPVSARREEIARAIAAHQVLVVCGETGSGKSTQLPKICLSLGRGVRGLIGHTQPRRIAARTLAARVAAELGSAVGATVGYKVRFSEQVGENTYVKLMTDGILLAETQADRRLEAYDTLIIDEAHERSLNIDFLLGYLKSLLPRRPDLKVIVTSATIDPEGFSRHFDGAPIIEVSGRTYPVEIRYRPPVRDEETEEVDLNAGIVEAVRELSRIDRGDILVFLTGEREIRDAAEALGRERLGDTEILPLYARLTAAEQQRIFEPHARRHIVLATNVAETSLTVPGVRYVIDTGLARVSRYSPRTKVQRLPIERISRSSAEQRAGRCGRTAEGVCVRLYSEEDHLSRPAYTDPEIRRTNLAAVILQLESLGFGEVDEFPFLDPPEGRYINDAYTLLYELGAVDEARTLTALGRTLARLPVDPRIGRLIVAGHEGHCLTELLIVAAVLGIQDPREFPLDAREAATAAQAVFNDERSDFLWFVNFWNAYEEQARSLSKKRLAQWCREHYVSPARVREWRDTWNQLRELASGLKYRCNAAPADYAVVHRALLTGYLSQIAFRTDASEYLGTRGIKPAIFPGSAQFRRRPKWFVAAQIVETSRLYARNVAAVEPEWIERVGAHLLKRSHSDPHWERRAGRVSAYEKSTLLGLTIASGRRVDFGRINPAEARDIFIREALVNGEFDTDARFFARNRALLEELRIFEHKARRLDILADEQAIFDFYDQRIPENVCERRTFERWLREAERADPDLLLIPREYLLRGEPVTAGLFPDQLRIGELDLALSYRFEPGHEEDGVTVSVPLLALTQLSPEPFEWLVPGLIKEKLGLLLRSLPKTQRRALVPIPQFVERCLENLPFRGGSLRAGLARLLAETAGVRPNTADFRSEVLPEHLVMRFRVLDEQGRVLAAGRDLEELQRRLGGTVRESFAKSAGWEPRPGRITRWDFGDLPATVLLERAGTKVTGYPALEDLGDAVRLCVVDTAARASALSHAGLRRLYMLELNAQVKYLRQNLPDFQKMSLLFAPIGKAEILREDIVAAVFDRVFLADPGLPAGQEEFRRRREQGRAQVVPAANALCAQVLECLERAQQLRQRLVALDRPAWREALADVRAQAQALVYPGFVSATPPERFGHLARYLKAAIARLDKLAREPARDKQRAEQLRPHLQRYAEYCRGPRADAVSAPLQAYRWMLEEFRVSLFAQELGTATAVSAARLDREWQSLAATSPRR